LLKKKENKIVFQFGKYGYSVEIIIFYFKQNYFSHRIAPKSPKLAEFKLALAYIFYKEYLP